jgi:hypothetical protein
MEGKIKFNELSNSQMQYDDTFNDDHIPHIDLHIEPIRLPHFRERRIRNEENEEIRYNRIKCPKKALLVFIFAFFGNWYFILDVFDLKDNFLFLIIYVLLYISLFFQMIYINILSFLLVLIFVGFKKFILEFWHLQDLYIKKFVLILLNLLLGTFCRVYYLWKRLINNTDISNKFGLKFLIFFPCVIMSTIFYFPLCLLINIVSIIFIYIKERRFSELLSGLDSNFSNAFNFKINTDASFII